jgi:hypothetical protein
MILFLLILAAGLYLITWMIKLVVNSDPKEEV